MTPKRIFHFKNVPGLNLKDKEYNGLPFGRQIEYGAAIADFKQNAKHSGVDCKRRSFKKGLAEFLDLYRPTAYFVVETEESDNWKSDSEEIWYKTD